MAHTLKEIAQRLKDNEKEVQLIYAFNSSGKTRLSREFKGIIAPEDSEEEKFEPSRKKILYYNAFTEDLFYWNNDPDRRATPRLKIHANSFTDWILNEEGRVLDITRIFRRYTTNLITPTFNEEYQFDLADGETVNVRKHSEVTFRLDQTSALTKETDPPDSERYKLVKISRSEESNFIWSVFFAVIKQVVSVWNVSAGPNPALNQFKAIEYIFVDDPVSSMDENHLIELAFDLARLVKSSPKHLKYIITTHNPLFFNVLRSELRNSHGFLLEKYEDGTFDLLKKKGASNRSFSYHLHIKKILEKAIAEKKVEKYHFMLLRNLYEKTASFLGYPDWRQLIPGDKDTYLRKILDVYSHRTLSSEEVRAPTEQERKTVKLLLDNLNSYRFFQAEKKE